MRDYQSGELAKDKFTVKFIRRSLSRKDRAKIIFILAFLVALSASIDTVLYFVGTLRYILIITLAETLLLIFSTAFLYNHYLKGPQNISNLRKRRVWNLALISSIYVPFYLTLYLLYLLGNSFVFDPVFFMTSYILPILLFVLINRTWWWNRKFPSVVINSGMGLKTGINGISDIVRTESVPREVEEAIRKFIAGRIDENELSKISSGYTYSENLLNAVVKSRNEMRRRFKW